MSTKPKQTSSPAKPKGASLPTADSVREPSVPVVVQQVAEPAQHSPPWSVATKVLVATFGLLLIALVIWQFQTLIRPLVIAAILAYLVNPLVTLLMQRSNLSRGTAVLVVYLGGLLLVIGAAVALGFVAFDQFSRLLDLLPNSMAELVNLVDAQFDRWLARVSALINYDLTQVASVFDLRELTQQALALIQPTLSRSGSLAAQLAQATINTVSTGLLIFFISFYLSKDAPQFGQSISDLAQQPGYRRDAERLMREFGRIWDAYLRGQVILGLVIGVVVAVCLSVLGVNNALGLGVLSGVLEFLPIIGPLIGTGAAVLVALFQPENYLGLSTVNLAIAVLVVMILIQQLENNLLVPRIVGDALDLHPLVVMVTVIMGASLAGILGAVLAAPVTASIKLLGAYAWRKLLDLPPFPEPEPPPKPKRGGMGFVARLRLWRLRLSRF